MRETSFQARVACRPCALLLLAGVLLGLFGCASAQHQIVGANVSCVSCHSDEKTVYDVAEPVGATRSGSTVRVRTSADSVAVCDPTFVSQDGARFVPVQVRVEKTGEQDTSIELEDGLWVLCSGEGDAVRAKLVSVDSANSETAVVEL